MSFRYIIHKAQHTLRDFMLLIYGLDTWYKANAEE